MRFDWFFAIATAAVLAGGCGTPADPCYRDDDCTAGQWCKGGRPPSCFLLSCSDEGQEGQCMPPVERGGVCIRDNWVGVGQWICAAGLTCNTAYDPPECEVPREEGGICGHAADCLAIDGERAICDVRGEVGACARPGTIQRGEACAEQAACADGLYCSSKRVCSPPLEEGEACDPYSGAKVPCAEELYCSVWSDACERILAAGEPCDDKKSRCEEGHVCRSLSEGDRCAPLGTLGDSCHAGRDCADGLVCKDGACLPPAGPGGPCIYHVDCEEGLVCDLERGLCGEPEAP